MHKIVVKIGTSTLTQRTQKLSRCTMLGLASQIVQLQTHGLELILVSSGAVATGRELFPLSSSKQVFASIGQVKLMQVWAEIFSFFEVPVGQILLTKEDFSEPRRTLTQKTIESLVQHRIVPVINENDVVAAQENRIGDNDNLAALVAVLIGADTLILVTDQEGLYSADPHFHSDAKLIEVVDRIDEEILTLAGGSPTSLGTGGMATKIEAARVASVSGIETIIVSASRPNVLNDLTQGKQIGTRIKSKKAS